MFPITFDYRLSPYVYKAKNPITEYITKVKKVAAVTVFNANSLVFSAIFLYVA